MCQNGVKCEPKSPIKYCIVYFEKKYQVLVCVTLRKEKMKAQGLERSLSFTYGRPVES